MGKTLQNTIEATSAEFQRVANEALRQGDWQEASAAMLACQWLRTVPGEMLRQATAKQAPLPFEAPKEEAHEPRPRKPRKSKEAPAAAATSPDVAPPHDTIPPPKSAAPDDQPIAIGDWPLPPANGEARA